MKFFLPSVIASAVLVSGLCLEDARAAGLDYEEAEAICSSLPTSFPVSGAYVSTDPELATRFCMYELYNDCFLGELSNVQENPVSKIHSVPVKYIADCSAMCTRMFPACMLTSYLEEPHRYDDGRGSTRK